MLERNERGELLKEAKRRMLEGNEKRVMLERNEEDEYQKEMKETNIRRK